MNFRRLPNEIYSGLTIIFSQPSRFDVMSGQLLSGKAGQWFVYSCLRPVGIVKYQCDLRIAEDDSELLPETRVVLTLGEKATHTWIPETAEQDLAKIRGYVFTNEAKDIKSLASFSPIDAFDFKDWELEYNPLLQGSSEMRDEIDTEDNDFDQKKKGRTSRENFRFWVEKDLEKVARLLDGNGAKRSGRQVESYNIHTYPASHEVIDVLTRTKGERLFIDLETDIEYNINTIGFSFTGSNDVYVLPTLRYDYTQGYGNIHQICRALSIALRDNIAVAHNGKAFDYFIMAWKYKLMIGRYAEDTMLMQQRCFPEAEKSLSHCISMWLDDWTYHKDDGVFMPHTPDQERSLWQYNALDVISMREVHHRQMEYTKDVPGLLESFQQVNNSIRPYLIVEMTGIAYDKDALNKLMKYNDRLMNQYLRCMKIMHGPDIDYLISNQKCVRYFHDALGYAVVKRTPKGAPGMNEHALLALALKYPDNAVIAFVLAFRALKKESGTLKFFPMWKELGKLITKEEQKEWKAQYDNK